MYASRSVVVVVVLECLRPIYTCHIFTMASKPPSTVTQLEASAKEATKSAVVQGENTVQELVKEDGEQFIYYRHRQEQELTLL